MYSVKINTSNTEELQRIVKILNESLEYSNDNWNSEERNPAMLVGYLEATIKHTISRLNSEIKNQQYDEN